MNSNLKYYKIYISSESNIKGYVYINIFGKINIDFDIETNKYGYVVFKKTTKVLRTLKKNYSKGIKLIQKEFNLLPLNNFNFREYKTYGW